MRGLLASILIVFGFAGVVNAGETVWGRAAGGGAPAAEYAALSSIDETTVSHVTVIDCDDLTCASPGTGSTRVPFYYNGSAWVPFPGAAAGIASVVEDTSPQAGGDFDFQGNDLIDPGPPLPIRALEYVSGGDWGQAIEDAVAAKGTRKQFTIALDGDTSALGQATVANLCAAPNATSAAAFTLTGAGASWSNGHPSRLRPASSLATGEFGTWTADFDVVANDAATNDSRGSNYDTITTPTDPRAAPYFLARGDIIYVSGFTNANNNTATTAEKAVPLATNELPFRVHRAEWNGSLGKIVVVPLLSKGTDAGLTTESDSDNESIRKANYQLKICGRQVTVSDIQFDGNSGNADIGVWFYGDNWPNLACQGANDPYATVCTGYGTGTMSSITHIGTGIKNFATSGHGLAGVMFQPAANDSAQMDLAYAIYGESRDDFIGVLANSQQAKPNMLIERMNIQNYQQFGVLHGSGHLHLDQSTIISANANCPADDSGCWGFYSSHNNRIGLEMTGNAIEVAGGNGAYIEGSGTNAARFFSIADNDFIASRSDSSGTEPVRLLVASMAGTAVIQPNRFYSNSSGVTTAPEVSISNATNATVPLKLFASSTFGGGPSGTQPTGFSLSNGILNLSEGAQTTHATDCTALTWGLLGDQCYEQDADTLYVCEPSSGVCDTAAEWRLVSGAGGGTVDDISGDTGTTTGANVTIAGGTNGVDTAVSADTLTITLDFSELGATEESALESLLDIAGEVTSTGMGSTVIADSLSVTSWTLVTPILSGKIDADGGAVNDDDCTGEQGLFWYDDTDSAFEFCNANSGTPVVLGGGSFDATTIDAVTWSDGANASNAWTFDVSGTDPVVTWGNGTVDFSTPITATSFSADPSDTAELRLTSATGADEIAIGLTDNGTTTSIDFTVDDANGDDQQYLLIDGANQKILASKPIQGPAFGATSTGGTLAINSITLATAAGDYDLPDSCDSATFNYVTLMVRDASETASLTVLDTGDTIVYKGLSLDANDELDSPGAALDSVTVVCMEADKWYVTANSGDWTDGGVAD